MALSAVLQSFLILVIVLLYSATVWRSLDSYFRDEFKKHLEKDRMSFQKLKQERLETAKKHIEVDNVVNALDRTTSELTEESVQTFSSEIPINCNKEKKPVNKYINQEEIEDHLEESNVCPFTSPTDIREDGGG